MVSPRFKFISHFCKLDLFTPPISPAYSECENQPQNVLPTSSDYFRNPFYPNGSRWYLWHLQEILQAVTPVQNIFRHINSSIPHLNIMCDLTNRSRLPRQGQSSNSLKNCRPLRFMSLRLYSCTESIYTV